MAPLRSDDDAEVMNVAVSTTAGAEVANAESLTAEDRRFRPKRPGAVIIPGRSQCSAGRVGDDGRFEVVLGADVAVISLSDRSAVVCWSGRWFIRVMQSKSDGQRISDPEIA